MSCGKVIIFAAAFLLCNLRTVMMNSYYPWQRCFLLTTGFISISFLFSCSESPGVSVEPETPDNSGKLDESDKPDDTDNSDSPTTRPNILLIMTDQQSYNTISAHTSQFPGSVYTATPNIDRLVRSGISFTHAYCANPVSVPSRFSLFTGVYGSRFGVRDNKCPEADEVAIRKIQQTHALGFLFRNAGYETLYGGKVHLPFAATEGGSKFAAPAAYGFDNYYTVNEREGLAIAASNLIREKGEALSAASTDIPVKPFLMVVSFLNPHDICVESSTNLSPEVADDEKDPEKVATIRMMRERLAAINQAEFYEKYAPQLPFNKEKPKDYPATKCLKKRFLDYPDDYWRQYRWIYGQLVSLVDSHIGEVLDALDAQPELKKNTLIIFTSDHGEMQGAHNTVTKGMPFDECQRVPFIFAGGGIAGERIDNTPVCNGVDLLPTLCELSGIDLPEGLDGISLAPIVKGGDEAETVGTREYLYSESETFISVLYKEYKLSYFDLDGQHSLLVDLLKDKGETQNIASSNKAIVDKLKQAIEKR